MKHWMVIGFISLLFLTPIKTNAGPTDSTHLNTSVVPNTLFLRCTFGITDTIKSIQTFFNGALDTLFVDMHVLKCDNNTLQMITVDTTITLLPTIADSAYHLVFRMVGDTNTSSSFCFNDSLWYWQQYLGYSLWPNLLVPEVGIRSVQLFPNPALNHIMLSGFDRSGEIHFKVLTETGNLVLQGYGVNNGIDISELHYGHYMLVVFDDKKLITKRIIKE